MHSLKELIHPDRNAFAADPFGYSVSGWHKWDNVSMVAGVKDTFQEMPTSEDLKSPILWLCQAHSLSEAAICVIRKEPTFESMPLSLRGICDCQFVSIGLMLTGYSLEVCLKGLTIINMGVQSFIDNEKKFHHHDLVRLSEFVPNITNKEKSILKILTHFIKWAGRYPDPGSKHYSNVKEIFELSEKYKITAGEVFRLSARILNVSQSLLNEENK